MIDPQSYTPKYIQLADILAAAIASGELHEGDPVPSETYLQQEHGLARGTVRRAIKILRERQLVYTIHARGTFVGLPPGRPSR